LPTAGGGGQLGEDAADVEGLENVDLRAPAEAVNVESVAMAGDAGGLIAQRARHDGPITVALGEGGGAHGSPPAVLRARPYAGARPGAGGATVRRIGPARPKS